MSVVLATTLQGTAEDRTLSVFAGAADITKKVDFEGSVIEDAGGSAMSVTRLRIDGGLKHIPQVRDQAPIRMVDHVNDVEASCAYVVSRHPWTGLVPKIDLVATDIGGLLDTIYIVAETRPIESDNARIGYFWGKYAGAHLSGDLSFVEQLNASLPAAHYAGMTLRQVLESVASQADPDAQLSVDAAGRPHYFDLEANAAPYNVVAGTPGAGEIAPEDLDIDFDGGVYFNAVYVAGGTPAGSGWIYDHDAIAAANGLVRSTSIAAPDCTTAAMRNALGNMYLGRVAQATARGRFSTDDFGDRDGGWRAGQIVSVTDLDHNIDAEEYRIARVTTTFAKVDGDLARRYVVEFGGSRAGQSVSGGMGASLGTGQLVAPNLGSDGNVYITADGMSVTDGS